MCLMASANLVGLPALLCEALGAHLYCKAAEAVPGSHANKTFGADLGRMECKKLLLLIKLMVGQAALLAN